MDIDADRLVTAAAEWLSSEGYDIVMVHSEVRESQVATWSTTLRTLGGKMLMSSLKESPLSFIDYGRTLYQRLDQLQVDEDRLAEALSPYADSAMVTGVRMGRLSKGNTTVLPLVQADGLLPADIIAIASRWLDEAPAWQRVGKSPGQSYGEVAIGIGSLGLTGFRFQQPVEIYPLLCFRDRNWYLRAKDDILRASVMEYVPKRQGAGYILRKAPAFLQAIVACIPTAEVAFLSEGKESRLPWLHYQRPKLARRIFDEGKLERMLAMAKY
jgi:hypothetical protein